MASRDDRRSNNRGVAAKKKQMPRQQQQQQHDHYAHEQSQGGTRRSSFLRGNYSLSTIAKAKKRKTFYKRLVESKAINFFFIVMTLWSLFSDDVRYAATSKGQDLGIDIVIVIITFMYIAEIVTNCYATENYFRLQDWYAKPRMNEPLWKLWFRRVRFGSFSFFLDLLATLSYILEISLYARPVVDWDNSFLQLYHRVGIVVRAGARASRVIFFIRSIKWSKLWDKGAKMLHLKSEHGLSKFAASYSGSTSTRLSLELRDELRETLAALHKEPPVKSVAKKEPKKDDEEVAEKSRVGAAMNYLMNQRVIVLVILMLVCVTLLTAVQNDEEFKLVAAMLQSVAAVNASNPALHQDAFLAVLNHAVTVHRVLSIQVGDKYVLNQADVISARRSKELSAHTAGGNGKSVLVTVVFDNLESSRAEAVASMQNTAFIFGVLVIGLYFMTTDVNKLIINPIERLVDLVRKISANPLGVEYKMLGEKEGFMPGMETTILLTTINRIGSLMQVGFGEAGAGMIAKNLASSDASGQLNMMGGGTMIRSIFGFCDVRQFTDTTECLQEEVMLFVNRIAFILHDIVVQCSGSANKNIGDAFLLAWKLDDKMSDKQVTSLADQALVAFCKTLIELQRYQKFIMNFSAAAMERLHKRFPNYEVRIGSGLHVGWAIEGAIGSNRKIDASYLSPHVNFTEFLESSTKEYGVPLLMSEPFFNLLSPQAKRYVRQVDRIRRSMAEEPVGLFVYDFDMTIDWNDEAHRLRRQAMAENQRASAFAALVAGSRRGDGRRTTVGGGRALSVSGSVRHHSGKDDSDHGVVGVGPISRGGPTPRDRLRSVGSIDMTQSRRLSSVYEDKDDAEPVSFVTATGPSHAAAGARHHTSAAVPSLSVSGIAMVGRGMSTSTAVSPHTPHSPHLPGTARRISQGPPLAPGAHQHSMARPMPGGLTSRKQSVATKDDADPLLAVLASTEAVTKAPKISIPRYSPDVWDSDADLIEARHQISENFRQQWDKGIQAYIKGDWQKARDIFHETVKLPLGAADGPSKNLIEYIDAHGGTAPSHWKEYRMDEEGGGH